MNYLKFSELSVSFLDHILVVKFNRPDQSNAFTNLMIEEICELLHAANYDPQVKVIIFTGEGKAFCSGGDIKKMKAKEEMFAGDSEQLRQNYMKGIQQIPKAMNENQKPTIAAVNGAAIGAGLDFACMCDLRIASDNAKFGETFAKLGLVPGDGGTYFLTRIVGVSKAMEMTLTARIYNADQAQSMGLISETYPKDKLIDAAIKLAEEVMSNSPTALQMAKKAIYHGQSMGLNAHLDLLAAYQGIAQSGPEHEEGLDALLEKRKPEF